MKLTKINQAIWVAGGLLSSVVMAEDNTSVLSSITISASPIHNHEKFVVPSQIDSISGAQKQSQESASLGEMLESIPGVNNQSTGAQAGKPVIRGMTGNRVKVLSNGQATDYQAYGARHNPNVESFLAERIEVIRGPQSVLYGSDAIGGVVNVIQAAMPYDQDFSGQVAAEYNSNNQEGMLGVKVGVGSSKFAIQAGASIREADNFSVPNAESAAGATPSSVVTDKPLFVGEVPNTNFKNRAGNIGFGYQADWGVLELRHSEWLSKQNFLAIEADDDTSPYEAVATGQILQNSETLLKAEIFTNSGWVIKPSWSHIRNQREATHDLPYETMAEDKGTDHYLDLLVKRNDYKLAFEHPKMGDFEGEIGIAVMDKSQLLRSGHLTPTADENKRAIYVFEEADYDDLLVQFGARYDTHSVKAPINDDNEHFEHLGFFDESNNGRDFSVFSGSLGATYRMDDEWSLAANLARGFRAPSIFELYAGGEHGGVQAFQIGNPELSEELSLNTDLSLRWQTDKAQMVATLYQNNVSDYIYLANTGKYRYSEATIESDAGLDEDDLATRFDTEQSGTLPEMQAEQTDARIRGLELSYAQRFNSSWSADLALEIIQGEDLSNHQNLPLIPANNLTLNGHFHPADKSNWKKQKLSLGVKLVDSKNAAGSYEPFSQFDDQPFGRASTEAYALWNFAYQAQVKLDKQNLYVAASVDNLFDTAYVDFLNTYKGLTLNPGRNIKLTMRLDF